MISRIFVTGKNTKLRNKSFRMNETKSPFIRLFRNTSVPLSNSQQDKKTKESEWQKCPSDERTLLIVESRGRKT